MAPRKQPAVEPLIRHTPGVHGGDACIRNSRITVRCLEALRRLGADDDDVLRAYPSLDRADLAAAWRYVADHRAEIDAVIARNEAA